ncbi:MAG: outer membrane protein [Rhodomicrobium sp.]
MGLRAILTGLTISLCAATAANAADFGTGTGSLLDTPFAVTQWNWGGFYGGWIVGYGTGDSSNYVSSNAATHGWASNNPDGVLLGGTAGFNWQYTPNWVLGVEADMSWADMQGNQHMYIYDGHDWSGGWDGFGTIRGRVGYAFGRTLVYGTGGIAFLHTNEVIVGNDADETNFDQGWHVGYAVGAGVEQMITDRLSAKAEFLYAGGFPEWSGKTGTVSQTQSTQYWKHDVGSLDIIRVGLNYKFF